MGQRSNCAATKDAQIKLRKEECAEGMEQRSNYAAVKDVQIEPCVEKSVEGTGYIVIHTINLLHLDQNTRILLQLNPCLPNQRASRVAVRGQ